MMSADYSSKYTDLILAIGGTEERLQMALGHPAPNGNTLLASREWTVPGQSIRFLTPGLKEVLCSFGIGMDAIGKIACVRGPGSFTGLRLVLAAAEGLAAGHNTPLAGIDYLPLLATGPAPLIDGTLHVLTYARRGLVYLQSFTAPTLETIAPLASLTLEEAVERMVSLNDTAYLMGSGLRKNSDFSLTLPYGIPGSPYSISNGTTALLNFYSTQPLQHPAQMLPLSLYTSGQPMPKTTSHTSPKNAAWTQTRR